MMIKMESFKNDRLAHTRCTFSKTTLTEEVLAEFQPEPSGRSIQILLSFWRRGVQLFLIMPNSPASLCHKQKQLLAGPFLKYAFGVSETLIFFKFGCLA